MDNISVLDSAYAPSIATSTSSVRPQDSVSMISEKPGNRLLSGRRTLEEPTIPRSLRTTSRQTARSEISALSKPRYGAQSARSRSQAPRSITKSASIASKAQSYQARSQSPPNRPKTSASTCFSRTSQLETIKELEAEIRKKLVGGSVVSLRALFKSNSAEILTTSSGVLSPLVTIDGLQRALCSFLNTNYINQTQVKLLLKRLLIDYKKPVHFETFYGRVRDGIPISDYPSWLDPAKRRKAQHTEYTTVLEAIKNLPKAELVKVLPSLDGACVTSSDVRRACERLGFYMSDSQFQKLWKSITGEKMAKGNVLPAATLRVFLGFERVKSASTVVAESSVGDFEDDASGVSGSAVNKRDQRKLTIQIEVWLKDRFRKAFEALKKTFEEADKALHHEQLTGTLPRASFRACLSTYGLQLSNDEQLEMFLARCGLSSLSRERVQYRKFLAGYQDRSEFGNCRKILADTKHRFNLALTESIGPRSTVSAVEARLLALFQGEYLSLLGTFHRLDRSHLGTLEPEEFRAAIESTLHNEFTDEEYEQFYYNICPLDPNGNVKYTKFMALFDAKGQTTPSMFPDNAKTEVGSRVDTESNFSSVSKAKSMKSTVSTVESTENSLRKAFLKKRSILRHEFERIDALNTGRLNVDSLHAVLAAAGVRPLPHKNSLRLLWKEKKNTFHKLSDGSVSFYELERWAELADDGKMGRHILPRIPLLGDDDKIKASKTLSNTQNILESQLVAAVENKIDWVRHQLRQMDSFRTGYISRDEFVSLCTELVPELYEQDAARISRKLDQHDDGRVGYVRWIKSILKKCRGKGRHTDHMSKGYKYKSDDSVVMKPMQKGRLAKRIVQRMGVENLSVLKDSLLKCDIDSIGKVKPIQFKAAIRGTGAALQDRDLRKLVAAYATDDKLTDYRCFLRDAFSQLG